MLNPALSAMLKCLSPLKTIIDCYSLSVVAAIICLQECITFLLSGFFLCGRGRGSASSHFAALRVVHWWTCSWQQPWLQPLDLSPISALQSLRAWLSCCRWWILFVACVYVRGMAILLSLYGLKNYDIISFDYGGQSVVTYLVLCGPVFPGNSHAFLISGHKYK